MLEAEGRSMSASGIEKMLAVVVGIVCVLNTLLLLSMSRGIVLVALAFLPSILGLSLSYILYRDFRQKEVETHA